MKDWKQTILYIVIMFGIPFAIFLVLMLFNSQNVFVWPFPFIISTTNLDIPTFLLFILPFLLMIVILFLQPKGLPIFVYTRQKSVNRDRCPECGTYLTGWENYCPNCGFNLKRKDNQKFH